MRRIGFQPNGLDVQNNYSKTMGFLKLSTILKNIIEKMMGLNIVKIDNKATSPETSSHQQQWA